MDANQRESVRQVLLDRRHELEERMERTHRHIFEKEEPVSANFSEQIKQTENDQLVVALEIDAKEELAQIARALQRLQDGNYHECSNCGKTIEAERLEALPTTEFCVNCASKLH